MTKLAKTADTRKELKNLEDCNPGATKAQVLEALRIVATTEVKSKPSSKKPS